MTFLGFSCRVAELGEGSEGESSEAREFGSSGVRELGSSEGVKGASFFFKAYPSLALRWLNLNRQPPMAQSQSLASDAQSQLLASDGSFIR